MANSIQHDLHVPVFDFSGGYNDRYGKVALRENEVLDISNFHLDGRGGLEKRRGCSPLIAATTIPDDRAICGLTFFITASGSRYGIIVTRDNGGGNIYSYDGAAYTDRGNVTAGGEKPISFANFKGYNVYTIFEDADYIPEKWNGSGSYADITRTVGGGADTIDGANVLCKHRERLILGDVTATIGAVQTRFKSLIWPSDAGTLDTWSSAPTGRIHLGEGDGESITCMLDVMGVLVVFKQNSLWRVTNLGQAAGTAGTTAQDAKKIAEVGAQGPNSACVVGNHVYFLDCSGRLWRYDVRGIDEDALTELSRDKFGPSALGTGQSNVAAFAAVKYYEQRNELWIDTSGAVATDMYWVYNLTSGGFTKMAFLPFSDLRCLGRFLDATNKGYLVAGTNDGELLKLDVSGATSDTHVGAGTSTITATVTTRHFPMGDGLAQGMPRRIDVYTECASNQTVTLDQYNDFATSASSTHSLSVLAASPEFAKRLVGRAKWVNFKFTQAANAALKLLGFVVHGVTAGEGDYDG